MALTFGALGGLVACASQPAPSSIDLSLASQDFGGVLSTLHFNASIGGSDVQNATIDMTSPNALPRAFHFETSEPDAPLLALKIIGYLGTGSSESPVLTRIASTRFVDRQARHWVVALDPRCLSGDPMHSFGGPVCAEPLTCIAGRCDDSYTPPESLQSDGDSGAPSDPCDQGPVDVILGNGASGFAALHNGDTLQMQKGPQGGHHIWLALRLRGFPEMGTTVRLSGGQPDGGSNVPSTGFAFTLDPDVGGYCRLTNLRFQLDAGGADYHVFLGQPLDVRVDVTSPSGDAASAAATIVIASTVAGE